MYLKKKGLEYETLKIIVLKTVNVALLQITSILFLSSMKYKLFEISRYYLVHPLSLEKDQI